MVDDKEIIGTEKFYNTKIFINTDVKLSDDITLKYVVIFMTRIIQDGSKFHTPIHLEETFLVV